MTEVSVPSAESVSAAPPAARPAAPSVHPTVLLATVGVGALMVAMAQGLLVPALPILPEKLHTSSSNVEWLLTSLLLVSAVAVPLLGRLGDMFGKRLMFLVALAALSVGSLVDALTDNIGVMILGRAIQGLSGAAIPLGISLLVGLLPRERVGSAVALISAMLGVGSALSLPLSGVIADNADYHVLFWITAIGGAAAFVAVLALVPESPIRTGGRVDLVGAALLSAGLVALLLPLAESANWGWGSARVIGLLAAGVALLAVLAVVERRIRQPLVDMVAFVRRPLILTNVASLLFGFALFASMIGTAGFVQAPKASGYGFGVSMVVGGLVMLPTGLGMLLLSPVAARLVDLWGGAATLALGAVVVAVGWASRMALTGALWEILVGSAIVGIGTGIGYAAMPSLINAHTPATELAAANGLNSLFRAIGSTLASALGGSILASQTISVGGGTLPSLTGYRMLFALCGAAAVVCALATFAIPRNRAATAPEPRTAAQPG